MTLHICIFQYKLHEQIPFNLYTINRVWYKAFKKPFMYVYNSYFCSLSLIVWELFPDTWYSTSISKGATIPNAKLQNRLF